MPSEASRYDVQVELRASTSISPDCSAVKRSLAESGRNLTLAGSFKTDAATRSEAPRDDVQVELRASTSISPDCSAVKRSLAESGRNLTLAGSLKTAAATATQAGAI